MRQAAGESTPSDSSRAPRRQGGRALAAGRGDPAHRGTEDRGTSLRSAGSGLAGRARGAAPGEPARNPHTRRTTATGSRRASRSSSPIRHGERCRDACSKRAGVQAINAAGVSGPIPIGMCLRSGLGAIAGASPFMYAANRCRRNDRARWTHDSTAGKLTANPGQPRSQTAFAPASKSARPKQRGGVPGLGP
jgi:hypothetical protein